MYIGELLRVTEMSGCLVESAATSVVDVYIEADALNGHLLANV